MIDPLNLTETNWVELESDGWMKYTLEGFWLRLLTLFDSIMIERLIIKSRLQFYNKQLVIWWTSRTTTTTVKQVDWIVMIFSYISSQEIKSKMCKDNTWNVADREKNLCHREIA